MNTVVAITGQLLYFQINLKLYHWNTRSYARHLASSELVDEVEKFTDTYVEYMQGLLKEKTPFEGKQIKLTETSTEEDGEMLVNDLLEFLYRELMPSLEETATQGLLNRAQELEETVIRTLYKFRLA